MRDEELLKLVEEKLPEELTPQQIELLRARLADSPELQQRLASHLQLEQYLSASLGKAGVTADQLVERAGGIHPAGRAVRLWAAAAAICAVLFLGAWLTLRTDQHRQVADHADHEEKARAAATADNRENGATGEAREGAVGTDAAEQTAGAGESGDQAAAVSDKGADIRSRGAAASTQSSAGPAAADRSALDDDSASRLQQRKPVEDQMEDDSATQPGAESDRMDDSPAETDSQKGDSGTKLPERAELPEDKSPSNPTPANPTPADSRSPEPSIQKLVNPARRLEPWEADDQLEGEVRPFADVLHYSRFNLREEKGLLIPHMLRDEAARWWAGLPGRSHRLESDARHGRVGLRGWQRLRAPWPEDAVLRLAISRGNRFWLYLWNGNRGAALRYSDRDDTKLNWAGYRAGRRDDQPEPDELELAATDFARSMRIGALTVDLPVVYDLSCQQGKLIVSRGDIRLLEMPCDGPPQEVFFSGDMELHGMRMVRARRPRREAPEVAPATDLMPADPSQWQSHLPDGARFEPHDDTGMKLTGIAGETSWAGLSLPAIGARQIDVQIEGAAAGTAVYLGDADGRPLYEARIVKDSESDRRHLILTHPDDDRTQEKVELDEDAVALVGDRFWVRMVPFGGLLKCFVSLDGRHWAQVDRPLGSNAMVSIETAGIVVGRKANNRSIRIRRLMVRPLAHLNALVDDDVIKAAPAVLAPNLGTWLGEVDRARPKDVGPHPWRTAAALQSQAAGVVPKLGDALSLCLLDVGQQPQRPLDQQLPFLAELIEAGDQWRRGHALHWSVLSAAYERLGWEVVQQGPGRPFSRVGERILQLRSWSNGRSSYFPVSMARNELLTLLAQRQWDAARQLSRRLIAYGTEPTLGLATWADAVAAGQLPDASPPYRPLEASQRHPFLVELSKEGFNTLAELEASLAAGSYQDACRIVVSARPSDAMGLLPSADDRRLWLSLPMAVAAAMREHPALLQTMREHFSELGQLRVREAMEAGDEMSLAALTTQFYGTEAAAEALLWLGDRALSAGDFAAAARYFRSGQPLASPGLAAQLAAHHRLAGALAGRSVGSPVTGTVELGEAELPADRFEQLIAETLKHRARPEEPQSVFATAETTMVAVGAHQLEIATQFRLGLPSGDHPERLPGDLRVEGVDWAGRQLAATRTGDRLLVGNRFAVAAYDVRSGQRNWLTKLDRSSTEAQHWPLVSMRPVVHDGRVFIRYLDGHAARLAALDQTDGRKLWTDQMGDDHWVISDPVVVGEDLWVLTAIDVASQRLIGISVLDARTGEHQPQRQLAQFSRSWDTYPQATITMASDSMIVTTGGAVICCDQEGRVRWLRRQMWLDRKLFGDWATTEARPPLLVGDALVATQPSSPAVECIGLESGELRWRIVDQGLRQVVGRADDQVVLLMQDRLIGVGLDEGELKYQRRIPRAQWALPARDNQVLVARIVNPGRRRDGQDIELIWLEAATGRPLASCVVDGLEGRDPALTPALVEAESLWSFFSGLRTPHPREAARLVPSGPAGPPPDDVQQHGIWTQLDRASQGGGR